MKSLARDQFELAVCIYKDASAKCVDELDVRDLKTLKSRFEHEGLSFFTITLPTLGKELEFSLSHGRIDSTYFRAFRKQGKAPAFLQGFFSHVFDETGRILHEPSIAAIEGIRQIAYAFKKLRVPCTEKRVRETLAKFKETEHVFQTPLDVRDTDDFLSVSRVLWATIFSRIDVLRECIPKHGPGATAEKISGNAKYLVERWHDRLEPYFPVCDTAIVSYNAMDTREFQELTIVPEDQEQPVRVIPVPKTLKGPRIIAVEPVCMQYTQQGLMKEITSLLESHWLTSGHINFTDQSVNRDLAINSSVDGKLCTLDLSSASDLVPYELAIRMFDSNPDLQDAISACRSKRAQLPNGEVIPLRKFASMGSALCFPIEAMYFYTICIVALLKKQSLLVTIPNISKVRNNVYVYGDDIIIPTDASTVVSRTLEKYYCKVNVHKSFAEGNFRESCGMDAFNGYDVTPTYIREEQPRDKRHTKALVSWVASANLFYKRGYWKTSSYMFDVCEQILGLLPIVGPQCAGLGKISFQNVLSIDRWSKRFQCPEVRTWVSSPVYQADKIEGYPALLKCLLSLENPLSPGSPKDSKHLERTARHGAVALKRRWTSPW